MQPSLHYQQEPGTRKKNTKSKNVLLLLMAWMFIVVVAVVAVEALISELKSLPAATSKLRNVSSIEVGIVV